MPELPDENNALPDYAAYLIVIAVGLPFLGFGLFMIYDDYIPATEWEEVEGTVLSSQLREDYDSEGDLIYWADISYAFDHGEKRYAGKCCDWGTSDYAEMRKLVDAHPPGISVDVLVDPEDPYSSRLKAVVEPFAWFKLLFAGVGAVIVGAGSLGLLNDFRNRLWG